MSETPDEAIARLTAGADPTPVEPGTWPSPGQWIAQFNDATVEVRLVAVTNLLELAQMGHACVAAHHAHRIKDMQHTIDVLRERDEHPLYVVRAPTAADTDA